MIKATIMIWFELENGEPRYKDLEAHMFAWDAQDAAEFYASSYRSGQCKIFDNSTNLVIGSSGFE